jgi:hypothetical protein
VLTAHRPWEDPISYPLSIHTPAIDIESLLSIPAVPAADILTLVTNS